MTMDITQRLREGRTNGTALRWTVTEIHREAADEIERLQRDIAVKARLLTGQGKEIERLRAALRDLLATSYAEECQECGIGHTEPWERAKALVGTLEQSERRE